MPHRPLAGFPMSLFVVTGCTGRMIVGVRQPVASEVVEVDQPDSWVVASASRRDGMHRYRYYEYDQVYYDYDAQIYYYQEDYTGPWLSVSTLPSYVVLEHRHVVDLD